MSANDDLRVNLDRAVSEILTLGGDTRLSIPSGARQNRYGCATEPDPEVVAFGSARVRRSALLVSMQRNDSAGGCSPSTRPRP